MLRKDVTGRGPGQILDGPGFLFVLVKFAGPGRKADGPGRRKSARADLWSRNQDSMSRENVQGCQLYRNQHLTNHTNTQYRPSRNQNTLVITRLKFQYIARHDHQTQNIQNKSHICSNGSILATSVMFCTACHSSNWPKFKVYSITANFQLM